MVSYLLHFQILRYRLPDFLREGTEDSVPESAVHHHLILFFHPLLSADTDYALVVIGQPYNGISGEGIDRKYLSLSEDQMDMVSTVAANYAKEGKKTIVIINTEYPVRCLPWHSPEVHIYQ